jgi:outer membrane protein TolC
MNKPLTQVFLLILELLLINLRVFSQDAAIIKKFTLKQAVDYALENNPSIVNAKLDKSIAKKIIWETTAIGLPQLNMKGSYSNIFKVPVVNFGQPTLDIKGPAGVSLTTSNFSENIELGYKTYPIELGVKENVTFDFTVSQLIFSGAYIVGLQASRTYFRISEQNLEKSQSELKEVVSNSYYQILILEENKKILESILENMNRLANETKEVYKQGFIEETDADQVQLIKTNTENTLNNINRFIDVAYNYFKLNLGLDLAENVELSEKVDDIVNSLDMSLPYRNFDVTKNINYRIMNNSEQLSRLNLKKDESSFLPTLAAYFNHQERMKKPEFDFMSPNTLGISLSFPIVTSGQRLATVSKRKMEVEKVVNSKQQLADILENEAISARNDFTSRLEIYHNNKQNYELAEKIYNRSLIKFKEGVLTSIDLTEIQNQYLTAQKNYFISISDLLMAKNKLEKIME